MAKELNILLNMSDIAAFLLNALAHLNWNSIGSVSGFIAAPVAAAAAVWSATATARQTRRKPPTFETLMEHDAPWTGWRSVRITIRNHAPVRIEICSINTAALSRQLLFLQDALLEEKTMWRETWATRQPYLDTEVQFPEKPPDITGKRALNDLAVIVAPDTAKARTITLIMPPRMAALSLGSRVRITWRYLDRRQNSHRTTIRL